MTELMSPMAVFVTIAAVCGFIYWVAERKLLSGVFRYVPPILLVVFVPAACSQFGILPRSSVTYDLLRDYALPFGLFLMVVTTDVRSVLKVGPRALLLMTWGAVGVMAGAILVFLLLHQWLPADSWKVFAAITGSWIGGGANFAAIQSAVDLPPSLVGPAIVVDATVGFVWLGVVLLAASYQHVLTRFYQPKPLLPDEADGMPKVAAERREISFEDLLVVLGVGLPVAALAMYAGRSLFTMASAEFGADSLFATVLGAYALGILFVTLLGVLLSLTPLRRLESRGAPAVSYAAQFLFFASLGAQADFAAVLDVPLLLAAGTLWIAIHVATLLLAARVMRAPMSLIAVCSIANISGPSTAAVVGAQYGKSWASLGALLGLFGHLVGTIAGLACGVVLLKISG